MEHLIRVTIIKRDNRKFYECRWIDPATGMKRTKTTKHVRRREAERYAAELEKSLNAGEVAIQQATWAKFREEYEETVFDEQKLKTRLTTTSTFNAIEAILKPHSVRDIDAAAIRKFTKEVRKLPAKGGVEKGNGKVLRTVSEFTVARHLTELRKILRWAAANNFLKSAPVVRVPEAKGRKGRDVTDSEFRELMRAVARAEILEPIQRASYRFFLKGLWWGGLRLQEALLLDWEDDIHICVDFSQSHPMFRIQATNDKGGKYRVLPMAPEFAELLGKVPPEERTGKVFKLKTQTGFGSHLADRASHVVSAIGETARVVVSEKNGAIKHASAHDLRRAFGVRWSRRVLPPVLMEMMRHENINTTMQFYVGQNAQRSASDAWAAYEKSRTGNNSGNTSPTDSKLIGT